MPEITKKFWGSPGTGKTTTLLNYLEPLTQTYGLERICFATYSNQMSKDFIFRLRKKLDMGAEDPKKPDERLRYFSTLHGVCKRLLEELYGKFQVADDTYKEQFCKENGIGFEKDTQTGKQLGNRFFATKTWLTNTMKGAEECRRWKGNEPLSPDIYKNLLLKWDTWKKEKGFIDFDDMLIRVYKEGIYPPTKVLILDEFQDLSPIQYAIYALWRDNSEIVLIAGDPNQSIYSFQGASPDFFINEPFEEEVLDESHRLGVNGWAFAKTLLQQNGLPVPQNVKSVTGVNDVIKKIRPQDFFDLYDSNDETLVLGQANYMIREVIHNIRASGIPFKTKKGLGGWGDKMVAIYNVLLLLKKQSGYVGSHEAKLFLDNIYKRHIRQDLSKKNVVDIDMPFQVSYSDFISYLNPLRLENLITYPIDFGVFKAGCFSKPGGGEGKSLASRDIIEMAYVKEDADFIRGLKLYVGTIHSRKGGEGDTVFLMDEVTQAAYEGDRKELARVFFVGTTRHKKALFIMNKLSSRYTFKLPSISQ
jgi:DNA helicase-2/ATP-dependent DNA helicase PcrA